MCDFKGNGIKGQNVTLKLILGLGSITKNYYSITDSNGYATVPINLAVDEWKFNITYNGNNSYLSSSLSDIKVILPLASVNCPNGTYDCSYLKLNVSAYDENSIVYYSFNNAKSWNSTKGSVILNLTEGNWSIVYYGISKGIYEDIKGLIYSSNFNILGNAPVVHANYGSGVYTKSLSVNLTALDDCDNNPKIYYTLDGSTPTFNSNVYSNPFIVSNGSTRTILKFFSADKIGHISDTITVYYFFGDVVADLDTGIYYNSVQSAINDDKTSKGDTIEVGYDLNENIILNKPVYLRASSDKNITWNSSNSLPLISFNNANNSIIEGFKFIGNDFIDLNGVSNCFIIYNEFILNSGHAIFDKSNFISSNNGIMNNVFSSNNIIDSYVNLNGVNTFLIKDNVFNSNKNKYAIYTNNTNYSMIMGNVIANCSSTGLYINGNDNDIENNSIIYNNYGIEINGESNGLYRNIISNNNIGIYANVSTLNINFNSIVNNSAYNLYVNNYFIVEANNNWWGFNNYKDINKTIGVLNTNPFKPGFINYNNHLCLNLHVSSYKINNGLVYGATVCADLNHNIKGEIIHNSVPDGSIINFDNQTYKKLVDGKAYANISVNGAIKTVYASLNNATSKVTIKNESVAHIVINSSALIHGTNKNLYYKYDLPLNESVDWFTAVWRDKGLFRSEIDLVVNGKIVKTFDVDSSYYRKNFYLSSNILEAIATYNNYLYNELSYAKGIRSVLTALNFNLSTFNEVESNRNIWENCSPEYIKLMEYYLLNIENNITCDEKFLSLIRNSYNLSVFNTMFVRLWHDNFQDKISISLNYLGGEDKTFYFTNSGNEDESYYCWSNSTCRNGTIRYVNGAYAHEVGTNYTKYEDLLLNSFAENDTVLWKKGYSYGYYVEGNYDGFLTFTFTNTKLNNTILRYWLDQKNLKYSNGSLVYNNGYMKAAYGSFLQGLLINYCNDLVADSTAKKYNITWERTSPMVMSVHDNVNYHGFSGESSFYFGRTAYGDVDSVKAFYFACSASFSLIEHYVEKSLFPYFGDNTTAAIGLGFILNNNGTLEIVQDGNYTLIREIGSNKKFLIFDSNTGLIYDQTQGISGSYCYSNQQTDWANDLGEELTSNSNQVSSYISGQSDDVSNFNSSTQDLLKSCKAFEEISQLFTGLGLDVVNKIINELGLTDSVNTITDIVNVVVSTGENIADYLWNDCISNPKFWSDVAGSVLFEAGMVASMTGVGLPLGLALMGAGTICTAYGSGLLDFNNEGVYYNGTMENWGSFGFSMGVNAFGAGLAGGSAKAVLKREGGEVIQKGAGKILTSDQRGIIFNGYTSYTTKVRVSSNAPLISDNKYLVERKFGATRTENIQNIKDIMKVSVGSNWVYDTFLKPLVINRWN